MPRNKDLKRLVRARMQKTGEAYTAARVQVTRRSKTARLTSANGAARGGSAPQAAEYAKLAGRSDATIREKTGCSWERWVRTLDHHGAEQMSHRDIAALVGSKYGIDGWWAQTVTVGYERIKGRRARGQRLDGSYEASKSRTFSVPVGALFDAWFNGRIRKRWLSAAGVKVRTATAPKSMRLGWSDGTIVAVWFTSKGKSKSSVALAHTKLPDREAADRLKLWWSERLDALEQVLTNS